MAATRQERRDREFTAFVTARRASLFRTACLLTAGDAHRAEDVVQQALAQLYVAWPRARRAGSVEAYARRTVVNAHLDEVRRPWRRERSTDRVPEVAVDAASVEEHAALWTALRALAPGQRRVVVLRHYLGLSVDETAAELGISPGTVKSQTSEALTRLRATLEVASPGGHP